ncbi:MAG: hypothetical protein ACRCTQ_03430 [Brevinemataceae bacterium]
MNYIIKLLILTFFLVFPIYCQSTNSEVTAEIILYQLEGIRGYKFGETFNHILNKENQDKEFLLDNSLTNQNRLVYRGLLFNLPVQLIYIFREGRLTSLSYYWFINDTDQIFYTYLSKLLSSKYGEPETQIIPTQSVPVKLDTYTKYTALTKADGSIVPNPVLTIELESMSPPNNPQEYAYILEFRGYDPDSLIRKRILSEDI